MKKSILISLLTLLALPALSCSWSDSDNIYLYYACGSEDFSERIDKLTTNNWKYYLGKTDDVYFFDADQIIKFARAKNDALMVTYVQNLQKYLKIANDIRWSDQWDYPSKEVLAQRNQTLRNVRAYALSKVKTKLRSQHALLYMRCNMVLGLNRDNITFWEGTASQFIETVYKDMMKNIYAGALWKTGRDAEAGEIFAEQGDYNSLMTQYYKRRSFAAIRQEYLRDPNAGALPFLLQDFVNNAQEAVDANGDGKLFIRDIKKPEAMQMIQFAGQVVKEGKTHNPAMWKTAQAWLQYLFGNKKEGYANIQQAVNMEGNDYAKRSAHVINLYIKADMEPVNSQYDQWLADELLWADTTSYDRDFAHAALVRAKNQIIVGKYEKAGRLMTATALSTNSDYRLDTMKVEQAEAYLAYLQAPTSNPLDKYLTSKNDITDSHYDLVGTKHLRIGQWEKAIPWLNRVPMSFYNKEYKKVYAANRTWTVEPWITRQWLKDDVVNEGASVVLRSNYKIDFAKEMLAMEKEASLMKGDAQCQRYYDLAVRYAQASFTGDCWFLTRYSKGEGDTLQPNESDFAAIANQLLLKASKAQSPSLKERALFARCYFYLNPGWWYKEEWNDQARDYDMIPLPQSAQYQALKTLADYERTAGHASDYVSNCDIYISFIKRYK